MVTKPHISLAGGNKYLQRLIKGNYNMARKTNKELGKEYGIHPRQVSKSRKRGWVWKDGKKVKYKAPS